MSKPLKNEADVKKLVKKVLAESEHSAKIYSNWPVPTGYGTPMLDLVGCANGRFFAVETKAPGGKLRPRQVLCIEEMEQAGGVVFVIDGDTTALENWVDAVCNGISET